jgi:uncharacterized membrane protein (Fun14 family)
LATPPPGLAVFARPQIDWSDLGKEVGLGAIFGFAVGYAAKKAMKVVLVVAGVLLLLAVLFEQKGIIAVKWDVLEATYARTVKPRAVTGALTQFAQRLGRLIPVSGGFVAGFVLGFRSG